MPNVNGKEFPYTEEGIIAAEQEAQSQEATPTESPEEGQQQVQSRRRERPPVEEEESTESPEVVAKFAEYVDQMKAISYQKEVASSLIKMGSDMEDSVEAVGKMAGTIVIQLDEKNNDEIPEDFIIPLAEHALAIVVDLVKMETGEEIPNLAIVKAGHIAVGVLIEEYGGSEEQMGNALDHIPDDELQGAIRASGSLIGGKGGRNG